MSSILFEVTGAIATITLNRPEKLNSFNREMALLMQDRLDQCAKDHSVRCVVITGAGKAFSAGQDLAEITEGEVGLAQILGEHYNPIVMKIRKLEKPVVAAVNGVAAGAGANIALCCDIVMVAASSSFIQAFSKIGLIPDSGGTHILPRLIGWQKASALMMLGEKVTAADAEKLGMVYKVYPDEDSAVSVQSVAAYLAGMPTKALAYTKQVLQFSFTNTFDQQLQDEDVFQQKASMTKDYKEGVAAFMEKRKPTFTGE